jgi:hypothetical protein
VTPTDKWLQTVTSAKFPSAAAAEGYDFHPIADDLGKVLTSTGRTSTWGGLDRRPRVPGPQTRVPVRG